MRLASTLALLLAACGTLGSDGGGDSNLPTAGLGPFAPLAPAPTDALLGEIVFAEAANLDDPAVLVRGDLLGIWFSHLDADAAYIEHADGKRLQDGFVVPMPVLFSTETWEGAEVRHPTLIDVDPAHGGAIVMLYEASGALGWAVSSDGGHAFVKGPGPLLQANGAEEGAALHAPSVVRLGDTARVYYLAEQAVWAAEMPLAELVAGRALTPTRLGAGNVAGPRRPFLRAGDFPFLADLGNIGARAALTPAGRLRHDPFVSGLQASAPDLGRPPSTIGVAASWDGVIFDVSPLPVLGTMINARSANVVSVPLSSVPTGHNVVLFYTHPSTSYSAIAAALSPY